MEVDQATSTTDIEHIYDKDKFMAVLAKFGITSLAIQFKRDDKGKLVVISQDEFSKDLLPMASKTVADIKKV